MPQLIAMIIVVVGAIIYMFQTFGGTGDTIKGIAQKTSIITEINSIKSGLKFAAGADVIYSAVTSIPTTVTGTKTLAGLGELSYFAEQMNEQLDDAASGDENKYYLISFGGGTDSVVLSLVATIKGAIPGIYVDISGSKLKANGGFLESQIANDLKSIATIDRHATGATSGAALKSSGSASDKRTPVDNATVTNDEKDGKFIVYFKDFSDEELTE